MSPKSLFIVILRIIGLYLLINILQVVPELLKMFSYLLLNNWITAILGIIFALLILLVYLSIVRYTLFNTEKLVEKLGLDKNFSEEKFEFNIHHSTIIKLAVIFIGGFTFIQYFVPLILNVYVLIRNQTQINDNFDIEKPFNFFTLVHHTIMVLIAYYMLTNSKAITNYIELKRKKSS